MTYEESRGQTIDESGGRRCEHHEREEQQYSLVADQDRVRNTELPQIVE